MKSSTPVLLYGGYAPFPALFSAAASAPYGLPPMPVYDGSRDMQIKDRRSLRAGLQEYREALILLGFRDLCRPAGSQAEASR